ncbi:MAG TPA: helix-turn-helix domain-containing GNAT family N-acetyltransferase, partial [Kofleriaceae bacterium]|nr:helix-turn-helix domain-containing GNAT family N-acetyltransferase [Kofleriaceae bacterium]
MRAFTRELARAGGLLSPDYLASGMTVGDARCLYEVGHADGLEISALADRLDLDLGHVSRIVSRLVERKLVTKRVERHDARARSVTITAKGARVLAVLDDHANQRLDAWLASKPAAVVDQLLSGLRAFVAGEEVHDDVIVRAPRPGELGHIIARHGVIYSRDFGYPAVFEHYVVQAFADFVTGFTPPRDQIWIAELTGRFAGRFAGSIAVKGLADATSQLRFLLVEPEARGRGIATQLVRRVLDHARAGGDRRVVLDTASDLTAARAIYAAHGFARTASVAGEPWLPRGVHSERWELALDQAAAITPER